MRKKLVLLMILAAALMALPALAQNAQDWQSTSAMQGTGSSYSPQVTAVGATTVGEMASTTTQPASKGPRRAKMEGEDDDWGNNPQIGEGNDGSPLGDAVLPLLLMSLAFGMFVYFRCKQTLNS